jgi:hypothetical protein
MLTHTRAQYVDLATSQWHYPTQYSIKMTKLRNLLLKEPPWNFCTQTIQSLGLTCK